MTQPKVSVIVPIYGVEKYIHQCIDSILNQTLEDIEILLIDDGSKDNCPAIIDEYAKQDSRIKAIHKENGGYGSAMNVGLANATGEYIGIVEPDDFIESEMYEGLYKVAKEYNSDIVKSLFINNYEASQKQGLFKNIVDVNRIPFNSFKITDYPEVLNWHPSIWSCIYKNNFIKEHNIRFVEAKGSGWTDNPFFIQTMCLAQRINIVPKYYYYWRVLDNTSSDALKDYTLPFDRLNEILDWIEANNVNPIVLEYVYKRIFVYINIAIGIKNVSNVRDLLHRIKTLVNRIEFPIIKNSKVITAREKKIYKMWKCIPAMYFLYKRAKFIEKIFSIKNSINKRYKIITILWGTIKIRRK